MAPVSKKCLVHMHCNTVVQHVADEVEQVLRLIPSLDFKVLDNGCCGNGDSTRSYRRAWSLFRMARGLTADIKESGQQVYSTGESCKVQLEQGTGGTRIDLRSKLLAKSFLGITDTAHGQG